MTYMADILHTWPTYCIQNKSLNVYGDVVLQGFEFIKPKIMLEQSEVLANKKKNNTATV